MMVWKLFLSFHILTFSMVGQAAVGDPARYWPNGSTLNVLFMDGEPEHHATIETYASEWSKHGNIRFRFSSQRQDGVLYHIRITTQESEGGGNASVVGTASINTRLQDEPSMWLPAFAREGKSDERLKRVVMHEFGHALGLKHEHQNPSFPYERTLAVHESCVEHKTEELEEEVAREKCSVRYENLNPEEFHYTDFDPFSIMMYKIKEGTLKGHPNLSFDKTSEISEMDSKFVERIYPF